MIRRCGKMKNFSRIFFFEMDYEKIDGRSSDLPIFVFSGLSFVNPKFS